MRVSVGALAAAWCGSCIGAWALMLVQQLKLNDVFTIIRWGDEGLTSKWDRK